MIPDAQIPLLLASQLPALKQGLEPGVAITKTISAFAGYTRNMIRRKQVSELRKCFSMAGVLYHNGSQRLRQAITLVFLYSLSPFLDSPANEYLPVSLKQVRHQFISNNALC